MRMLTAATCPFTSPSPLPARRGAGLQQPCDSCGRRRDATGRARTRLGADAEVIDLRTLFPLDIDTVTSSLRKTGRCVIAHEASRASGLGAELAAQIQQRCFFPLEAAIERVTGWDTPYPHAFEWQYFPEPQRVQRALRQIMQS